MYTKVVVVNLEGSSRGPDNLDLSPEIPSLLSARRANSHLLYPFPVYQLPSSSGSRDSLETFILGITCLF